jgi:hypothetical protein
MRRPTIRSSHSADAVRAVSKERTMSNTQPVIDISGVKKVYTMGTNKVYALRGVDLKVTPAR